MHFSSGKHAIFVGALTTFVLLLAYPVAEAEFTNPFYNSAESPEEPAEFPETSSWFDSVFNSTESELLTESSPAPVAPSAPPGMEIQGEDFVVQTLLSGEIEALGCVQHATGNMTAMMFFGANSNTEERQSSPLHFFNVQIMERFEGAAWPVFADTVRVGAVENIVFETDYTHQMPSEERCDALQAISGETGREMTQEENDDWIHCAKACNQVWQVIEASERQMTDSERRLLKYCDRSAFGLIAERAAMYRRIGGFLEMSFSKNECEFPGNGTINCGHRRDVNLGGLPVNGVDLLGKQEVSFTDSSFIRKYWLHISFLIKDTDGAGTHRYPILIEYNVNETLFESDGSTIESMDECQPLG